MNHLRRSCLYRGTTIAVAARSQFVSVRETAPGAVAGDQLDFVEYAVIDLCRGTGPQVYGLQFRDVLSWW